MIEDNQTQNPNSKIFSAIKNAWEFMNQKVTTSYQQHLAMHESKRKSLFADRPTFQIHVTRLGEDDRWDDAHQGCWWYYVCHIVDDDDDDDSDSDGDDYSIYILSSLTC